MSTSRPRCRRATTTAGIGPATICSPTASSRWTSRPGKRIWHFQTIHHDIWDWDLPCAPILADITVNGRPIKAVAQPSKQGFLYVFDRTNGQPVWPIEERPVAKGDVPGEWYSPTQPFPTRPPAYERQGVTIDDLIDFTPELRAEAVKIACELQDRAALHTAGGQQVAGPAGHPHVAARHRRRELAGRIVRSRDGHVLHFHEFVVQRAGSRERPEAIGHGFHFGPGAGPECAPLRRPLLEAVEARAVEAGRTYRAFRCSSHRMAEFRRSISTRAISSGRSPTARHRTTSGITPRSRD